MSLLPSHARTVVIGGGVIGCSIAYHLAREGREDIVVLERSKLTSGTTWHAAGLVRRLRPSATLTKLINIFKRDTLHDLHPALLFSLRIRKHLGVLSLYYLMVHVLMSLLIFNPSYYGKFFLDPAATSSKFTAKAEISFFFGIVGFSECVRPSFEIDHIPPTDVHEDDSNRTYHVWHATLAPASGSKTVCI